jgi:N-acetylated-alpha-linked acidic dipeptidase
VILFSDPKDKAFEGRNFTFPDSWWLPGMGVESGSLYVVDGDPLTPAYPAIGKKFPSEDYEINRVTYPLFKRRKCISFERRRSGKPS